MAGGIDRRRHPGAVPGARRHPRARDAAEGPEDRRRAAGVDPDPGRADAADDQRPLQAAHRHAAGPAGVLAHRQHRHEHLLQAPLDGQPFYVIAEDGNLQNQATRDDDAAEFPRASASRRWSTGRRARHLPPAAPRSSTPGPTATRTRRRCSPPSSRSGAAGQRRSRFPSHVPASCPTCATAPIAKQRTIVFADTANPNQFTINGKPFNADCVDTVVEAGRRRGVDDPEHGRRRAHVFHIHQLDFQVTEVNGVAQPFTGYQDVVDAARRLRTTAPSSVKVIMPFDNPVIVGKFVYPLPHHPARGSGHDGEHLRGRPGRPATGPHLV